MSFMKEYAQNSGQAVNTAKSQLFLGKSAIPRQMRITNILGINVSVFSFTIWEFLFLWDDPNKLFCFPLLTESKPNLVPGRGDYFHKQEDYN